AGAGRTPARNDRITAQSHRANTLQDERLLQGVSAYQKNGKKSTADAGNAQDFSQRCAFWKRRRENQAGILSPL
ncbi:MAG: hypothetical protein MSD70_10550, partial [Clostridiales bacterium]|nr:hypothetical protein [Clostridiales bacterium]